MYNFGKWHVRITLNSGASVFENLEIAITIHRYWVQGIPHLEFLFGVLKEKNIAQNIAQNIVICSPAPSLSLTI